MQKRQPASDAASDPVLIVGAGPTGLVLAIELARRGIPHRLIDQRPHPLPWDRAAVVKSRSLEIFEGLGLADAFLERGQALHGVDFYSHATRRASIRLDALDTPFPFTLAISESETERLLTEKLAALGGTIERNVEFVALEEGDTGVSVRVRVQGEERRLAASWVVGTDGLHSRVRDAAGLTFDGHDYALSWGVIDLEVDDWPHLRNVTAAMFDPLLIAIPMGGGRWRAYVRWGPTGAVETGQIREWLAQLAPGVRVVGADEPKAFHTHCRIAGSFRAGRILLAGDAAHACSPIEGHGMNTGIQDAFNLGWKLALVTAGLAAESLLDSYDAERRPVAAVVASSGDDAEANAAAGDPRAIETVTAFLANEKNRHKAAYGESEIGLGYDHSPIIPVSGLSVDSGVTTTPGYRVGDAGPLIEKGGGVRLHELLWHTRHTLFLLIGDAGADALEEGLELVRRATEGHATHVRPFVVTTRAEGFAPGAGHVLLDETATVHARLGGGDRCLCLVRPDGHLGLRSAEPMGPAVKAYLAGIFT